MQAQGGVGLHPIHTMRAQDVVNHIVADLAGATAQAHDPLTIVNYAAQAMESAREWRYLRRFRKDLKFRAPILGSAATFTNAGNVLTLTGAFAAYTFVPGDFVTLTLNAVESGDFKIVSKTDSDNIVLDADGITSDYSGTVTFDLNTSRIALPDDVGSITQAWGNFNNCAYPLAYCDIAQFDSEVITGTSLAFGYAVEWQTTTAKSTPTQVLKIWPEQQSAKVNAASLVYLRKWPTVTSDEDVLPIPGYMDALMLEYAKAFARAWDESSDVGQMVAAVEMGYAFKNANRADARSGAISTPPKNTAIQLRGSYDPSNRDALSYFPTLGF